MNVDLNSKSGVDNASVIDSLLRSQITSDPRYPTFFFKYFCGVGGE